MEKCSLNTCIIPVKAGYNILKSVNSNLKGKIAKKIPHGVTKGDLSKSRN